MGTQNNVDTDLFVDFLLLYLCCTKKAFIYNNITYSNFYLYSKEKDNKEQINMTEIILL